MNINLKGSITAVSKCYRNGKGAIQQFITVKNADTNEFFSVTAFDELLTEVNLFQQQNQPVNMEVKMTGSYLQYKATNYLNLVKISKAE